MSIKSNNFQYLLCLLFCILCLSCAKETSQEGTLEETVKSSGWISHLGLESYYGRLLINNSNEYQIVGNDYVLKVDVDGNVTEEMPILFSEPPSGLYPRTRLFNEKIYNFAAIGPSGDPDKNIVLEIYDLSGNLLQSTVLEANYQLVDMVIEEDKMTLVTWDWDDPTAFGARTNIFQVDYNGQLLFTNNLSSIPQVTGRVFDLMLLEDGNFLFEYDKTLHKVNNKFEPISSIALGYRETSFVEGPNGNIFVGGIESGITNTNKITKLDKDLNKLNEITFSSELITPIEPSITNYGFGSLAVHGENLYTQEVAIEYGQELRLQCFDLDLNKKNEIILNGSGPITDFVINELGGVSFLYGVPYDTPDGFPDGTPTEVRLIKLNVDCELPELIINN